MITLQDFAEQAETATPAESFQLLERMVQQDVGAVIFSCSTFDLAAGSSRRIHSNLPDVYPVSGLKPITPNRWTAQVLDRRQAFVSNRLDEIATVFPDHELIGALGCGAVINMPVLLAGDFLGTVNVLHEAGYYTSARVAALKALRPAAMLCFAALAGAGRG
jgi:hypothetical protein